MSFKQRSSKTSFERCIICQEKGGVLGIGTVDSKTRIREVSETRQNFQDTDRIEVIDKITKIDTDIWADQNIIKWHILVVISHIRQSKTRSFAK